MLVATVVFTIRPLWYFAIFAKNGFATVGVVPPGRTLSTILFGLNTKRWKFSILRNDKYRISEWAGFQVWKFLHPKGWKNLQKLAHGKKLFPPKGRRPAGCKSFLRKGWWFIYVFYMRFHQKFMQISFCNRVQFGLCMVIKIIVFQK